MIEPVQLENRAVAPQALTDRQRQVLSEVERYVEFAGEAPSVRFLARRLSLHPTTVEDHLRAICRKGWLRTPRPSVPRP